MKFDGDATIGILRTHRAHVAHHGNSVTVFEVIVTEGARNDPCQCFSQLGLCHEPNINGGCDIVVDVTRMRRISRPYDPITR
jgi:hypothetical protein